MSNHSFLLGRHDDDLTSTSIILTCTRYAAESSEIFIKVVPTGSAVHGSSLSLMTTEQTTPRWPLAPGPCAVLGTELAGCSGHLIESSDSIQFPYVFYYSLWELFGIEFVGVDSCDPSTEIV